MKNLEQLMASFLCRKDFLDPEGTKSGGVPHIQLSESIKIRRFDDLYQLDAFYLAANNRVHLLMTNPQGEVVNVTFSTFMNIFPNTKESPEEYIYEALSQIILRKMRIQKDYKKTKVNKINQGTYFKLKPTDTAPVWVRDHFDRATQTYACHKYEDSNHETFLKGNRDIYIDFTF